MKGYRVSVLTALTLSLLRRGVVFQIEHGRGSTSIGVAGDPELTVLAFVLLL